MRRPITVRALLAAAVGLPCLGGAAQTHDANVRIAITDAGTGEVLHGVRVRLLNAKGEEVRSGITDAEGRFADRVSAGACRIEYGKVGYVRNPERQEVVLASGETKHLAFDLIRTVDKDYYTMVAARIQEKAARVATLDKEGAKHVYAEEWARIMTLPETAREQVAVRLRSTVSPEILAHVPAIQEYATKGEVIGTLRPLLMPVGLEEVVGTLRPLLGPASFTNSAPAVSGTPASGSGSAFRFAWNWSDADGDVLSCMLGGGSPPCSIEGDCASIGVGGTASGSRSCELRIEPGQPAGTQCTASLSCSDGWTSSSSTVRLLVQHPEPRTVPQDLQRIQPIQPPIPEQEEVP